MRPWPAIGSVDFCRNIDGAHKRVAGSHRGAIAAIQADMTSFRTAGKLSRLVMINLASTERLPDLTADAFERALDANDAEIGPAMLYAYAAITSGTPYGNFAPSHAADAAFSVGGTLAAHVRDGGTVTVLTCFTGNVARPQGFALACQRDKGLDPDIDYMALRRAEDVAACAAIGAAPVHLPFLEAPHRGYPDARALFGPRLAGDDMAARLAPALRDVIDTMRPDLILGPLGLGDHVDHHVVRDALADAARGYRLLLWEDWPYLDRPNVARPVGPTRTIPLDDWMRDHRLAMCAAYASQIGYQFGTRESLDARIAAIDAERLYPLPA